MTASAVPFRQGFLVYLFHLSYRIRDAGVCTGIHSSHLYPPSTGIPGSQTGSVRFPAHPAAHFPGQDVHENFSGGANHSPHQMAAVAFSLTGFPITPWRVQVWFPVLSRYAACQGMRFHKPP